MYVYASDPFPNPKALYMQASKEILESIDRGNQRHGQMQEAGGPCEESREDVFSL